MRNYALKMDDFEITPYMYRELVAFCRQYDDKKQQAAWARNLSGSISDGVGKNSQISDPTYVRAMRADRYQRDCDQIEQTAKEVGKDLEQYLLRHVTRGIPFGCLGVPCGKNYFSRIRRKFFFVLAQKRGMI